jgi:hypothetical protein
MLEHRRASCFILQIIIRADTQITSIYIPEGDAGVMYPENDILRTTWTIEAWEGDFLNECQAKPDVNSLSVAQRRSRFPRA